MSTPSISRLRGALPRSLEQWQRNLAVLWLAQAVTSLGFSFFFPFIPLFIQDLGVSDPGRAAFWSGVAGGVGGLFMMVSGPIWGVLGDRWGLKKNVLRSMFGSALLLGSTALVTDVYQLVAMRIALGLVSGVWITVMALASASAPRERVPFAIGVVQSASFLGFTVGPLAGGLMADALGFRASFVATGVALSAAGLLVLLLVRDAPRDASAGQGHVGLGLFLENLGQMLRSRAVAPVLLTIFLVQVGPTIMLPVLPVFIGSLSGEGSAAASAGVAFSLVGMMGMVSSLVTGRLVQRVGLVPIFVVCFAGASALYLALLGAGSLAYVYTVVALLGLFNGGLNTLSFSLVGTTTERGHQGAAYGVAQSASALAWGSGPLMGGAIAGFVGLRPTFLVNALALMLAGLLVVRLVARRRGLEEGDRPAPASTTAAPAAR